MSSSADVGNDVRRPSYRAYYYLYKLSGGRRKEELDTITNRQPHAVDRQGSPHPRTDDVSGHNLRWWEDFIIMPLHLLRQISILQKIDMPPHHRFE